MHHLEPPPHGGKRISAALIMRCVPKWLRDSRLPAITTRGQDHCTSAASSRFPAQHGGIRAASLTSERCGLPADLKRLRVAVLSSRRPKDKAHRTLDIERAVYSGSWSFSA